MLVSLKGLQPNRLLFFGKKTGCSVCFKSATEFKFVKNVFSLSKCNSKAVAFAFSILHTSHFSNPALATLEADKLKPSPVEGLEVRLAAMRDGVVDIHTAEGAVGRAQVNTCLKCSLHCREDTQYSWKICRTFHVFHTLSCLTLVFLHHFSPNAPFLHWCIWGYSAILFSRSVRLDGNSHCKVFFIHSVVHIILP